MQMTETFQRVKAASKTLTGLSGQQRHDVLLAVADAIVAHQTELLEANRQDLSRMDPQNPLYDRLMLTAARLEAIAADMRHVAELPSPLGLVSDARTLPNGLRIHRVSVPFGVIGVVYEARPNVTFDVFALCFKSGNACVLKGGRDAEASNEAGVRLIKEVLRAQGIDESVVELLPATHEATAAMLGAVGYVDVCIPRGGRRLIDFVRDNARVPVIETGAGVVHAYFDKDGDIEKGKRIILNAKTRRVSVCNALDCLIIHRSRLADLPALLSPLLEKNVTLYLDEEATAAVANSCVPSVASDQRSSASPFTLRSSLIQPATIESYGTEFMDYKMNVVTVASLDEAIAHIDRYGSGHSESIITENETAARRFQQAVDAACVYWNVPTSFTDGAQFGLGAEIGISTQKLGPRGPMGLREITTYKWIIEGEGQIRA